MIYTEVERNNWAKDKAGILSDLDYAMQAISDVQQAYDQGSIDFSGVLNGFEGTEIGNFITEFYLYEIADYVLRGDDGGDDFVRQTGQSIIDQNKKKYEE